MGKASSSKKIKRVQQAGASRSPGQRRQIGFPGLVIAIIVVGLALTALSVNHRRHVEQVAPTVDDHWVEAYGTFICDGFIDPPVNIERDAPVDIHADGLIHVHPTKPANAGDNSVFGLFLQSTGIQVGEGTLTMPDGKTHKDGDDCNGKPGRVALYVWPPQATEHTDPRIVTNNIASTRFADDGQSYVLAFAPRGAAIKLPPSNDRLKKPDNREPKVAAAPSTTTVPGASSVPSASTVAPPDNTTTTTGG